MISARIVRGHTQDSFAQGAKRLAAWIGGGVLQPVSQKLWLRA